MERQMPESALLSEVYAYDLDDEMPPIEEANFDQQSLPALLAAVEGVPTREELRLLARNELLRTMQSIREDSRPSTVLHVLLLEDSQSRAEIAAALRCEPSAIALNLDALAQERIVRCSLADGWIHYSIARPVDDEGGVSLQVASPNVAR